MENSGILFGQSLKVSYLQARDPSILSWNKMQQVKEEVKHNLQQDFGEVSDQDFFEENDTLIKVFLRVKKAPDFSDLYEINGNHLISKFHEESHATRNADQDWKRYEFSKIFGPDTSQGELFHEVIKPKILKFINGENSTLMAYGASGAGKTFTMVGTADEPGIIPRALEYLFRTLPPLKLEPDVKITSNHTVLFLNAQSREIERKSTQSLLRQGHATEEYKLKLQTYKAMQSRLSNNPFGQIDGKPELLGAWVSFAEIYNELVYDLLQQPPPRGKARPNLKLGGLGGQTFIRGLRYFYVSSSLEAYSILQYGLQNLKYAETALNSHSSRSHSIFSILLVQGSSSNATVSVFNFCDLAGSERLKKTMNVGCRLKESSNINTSLLVLGRCISTIREGQTNKENQPMPPFRESKLTQLFQKALAGQEDIMLLVNINPSQEMYEETQHVLNFSSIAKVVHWVSYKDGEKTIKELSGVKTRKIEKDIKSKPVLSNIKEANEEVEELREQIAELTQKMESYNFFTELSADLTLENGELKKECEELREENNELRDLVAEKDLQLAEFGQEWAQKFEDAVDIERAHISTNLNVVIAFGKARIEKLEKSLEESRNEYKKLQEEYNRLKYGSSSSSDEEYDSDVIVLDSSTSNNELNSSAFNSEQDVPNISASNSEQDVLNISICNNEQNVLNDST